MLFRYQRHEMPAAANGPLAVHFVLSNKLSIAATQSLDSTFESPFMSIKSL
uniref:Uncharacterized protein n=1 Tax=Arsenophonus nasoniae TaxID=638 RepID=D2TXS1_9GAMM|nr:hypothetical protein ARN_09030 [Arsenophonus nasoniae]